MAIADYPTPSPPEVQAARGVARQIREEIQEGVDRLVESQWGSRGVGWLEDGAAPGPHAPVSLTEHDSTLYFPDTSEIAYLQAEVEREYAQDLGCNVLALLFDTFELQSDEEVRSEVIAVVTDLLPRLLLGGDLRSVVYLLCESRVVLGRAPELSSSHRTQLSQLTRALSKPEAVSQLLHALDEARVEPTEKELIALFEELSPDALVTVLKWFHRFSNDNARRLLDRAICAMAELRPDAVRVALRAPERIVILGALRLVAELGLPGMSDSVESLAQHEDVGVRLALVPALNAVFTPQTMDALVELLEDPDPDVRIASVKALSGRAYQGALAVVEEYILQQDSNNDLTERRAFFEAYGNLAGGSGVANLRSLLLGGRLGIGRGDSETRACAALHLVGLEVNPRGSSSSRRSRMEIQSCGRRPPGHFSRKTCDGPPRSRRPPQGR